MLKLPGNQYFSGINAFGGKLLTCIVKKVNVIIIGKRIQANAYFLVIFIIEFLQLVFRPSVILYILTLQLTITLVFKKRNQLSTDFNNDRLTAIILKEDTPRGKKEMPIPGRYLLIFPANKGKRAGLEQKCNA